MRRFFLRLFLLAAPFGAYAFAVWATDPFDYFRSSEGARRSVKSETAGKLDPVLWKLSAYLRAPRAHILLGDSRMDSLGEERIGAAIGAPVANLAYGGGSLSEAIRTFWIAARQPGLASVTIGVNLDTYNQSNAKDRVGSVEAIERNPALYFTNRLVAVAAWYQVLNSITGSRPEIGRPPMTRDEFWRYQLDVTAKLAYGGYRDPVSYRIELADVARECMRRHITLRFVIFPEHADLVARASRSGLESAAQQMRADLTRIGRTFDFSRREDWIENRTLFLDPFHFTPPIALKITEDVWGGESQGGKIPASLPH
jgi:hypothetical protein